MRRLRAGDGRDGDGAAMNREKEECETAGDMQKNSAQPCVHLRLCTLLRSEREISCATREGEGESNVRCKYVDKAGADMEYKEVENLQSREKREQNSEEIGSAAAYDLGPL